jgi:4-oxalocrotonate tautomerase
MPHVIVKIYSGRSQQQKDRLAQEVSNAVMSALNCEEKSISVGVEEFDPQEWTEKVYRPDIIEKAATLYKKPGYKPAA